MSVKTLCRIGEWLALIAGSLAIGVGLSVYIYGFTGN
jgi:hypothetical protein